MTKTKTKGTQMEMTPTDQAAVALKDATTKDSALDQMAAQVEELKGRVLAVTRIETDEDAEELGQDGRRAADMNAALETDRTALTKPLNAVIKFINAKWGKIQDPLKEIAAHARTVIGVHQDHKRDEAEKARFRAQTVIDIEAADLDALTVGLLGRMAATWELKVKGKTADAWETAQLARVLARVKDLKAAAAKHAKAVDKAETKGAPPPPPPPPPAAPVTVVAPQVNTRLGGTTSANQVWDFEIIDPNLVPRQYLLIDETGIRRAVIRDKVREIAGVRIFQKSRVNL